MKNIFIVFFLINMFIYFVDNSYSSEFQSDVILHIPMYKIDTSADKLFLSIIDNCEQNEDFVKNNCDFILNTIKTKTKHNEYKIFIQPICKLSENEILTVKGAFKVDKYNFYCLNLLPSFIVSTITKDSIQVLHENFNIHNSSGNSTISFLDLYPDIFSDLNTEYYSDSLHVGENDYKFTIQPCCNKETEKKWMKKRKRNRVVR